MKIIPNQQNTTPSIWAHMLSRALTITPILWAIDWFPDQHINWAYWPTAAWLGVLLLRPLQSKIAEQLTKLGW
ncbi:hypothetical protein DU000_08700 [Parvibium lacunae]|uniref:Uncharacterized protein n=2 Tax=Parvibium lacunae TaxID=1888893 RepID=A0A368L1S6_9BURK|nr:hypothetical protein DU000_08700 [Parvibium lacunae]